MTRRSRTGLMLVDNPKRLFKSICILKDKIFSEDKYQKTLGSLTKKGHVHEKTSHTYFYTATIFTLIEKTSQKSHTYKATSKCKEICNVIDSDKETYRRYLKGLLLSNKDKGSLFNDFLNYTLNPKKVSNIQNKFGKVPTKTLIAFCLEAGLIVKYGKQVKSIKKRTNITINNFYDSLIKVYKNFQKESHVSYIYVPIDKIRDMVSLDLGLESHKDFDDFLQKTIISQFGTNIYLHGAPPQEERHYSGFKYNNKRYAFLSVRFITD